MWLYIFVLIAIVICLWVIYNKKPKENAKPKEHIDPNSYLEYSELTNDQIRAASKTDEPAQKILLILKTHDTKQQLYLTPNLKLTTEPSMENVFYVHSNDPFLLYNYYRGLKYYQHLSDKQLKDLVSNTLFIDADSMTKIPKCYILNNNNNMSFGLTYIDDSIMHVYNDNDKITVDSHNKYPLAEFIIVRVEDDVTKKIDN